MKFSAGEKWIVAGGVLGLAGIVFAVINRDKIKTMAKDIINYAFSKEQEFFLTDLHTKYQNVFRSFIADADKKLGYKVLITSGYRSFKKQAELKLENSDNALPGKSMHNYGLALDINLISKKDGTQLKKSSTSAAWEKTGIVELATKYGLKWGGGGTFGSYHDPVHFEIPLGGSKMYADAIKQFGSESKVVGNKVNIA